ncbi:dual specificity protein phosphatase 19 [Hetaerina americana]|uniref:dual specificity protein phosphatase 19 n=1 Tax=Hetaerina americana TaxID=62018 RepID=UPI003A7F3E19
MSFLKDISARKEKLRHCQTVVTNSLGESFIEDSKKGSVTKFSGSNRSPGYVVDTKPDLQLAEVIPGLYLGSQDPTGDKELLQANGITHVLSFGVKPLNVPENMLEKMCGVQGGYSFVHPQNGIIFVYIPFLDIPEASLIEVLPKCFPVIDSALSTSGKIFVHCNAGVSRSPSVVLAYILYRSHFRKPWASISYKEKCGKPLSLLDALELLRTQRQCIKPNPGFLDQLRQYECQIIQDKSD